MTERNIGRNNFNDTGTANGAIESPWSNPRSFQQLGIFESARPTGNLPIPEFSLSDNAGRPVGADPNIIQLVGGGTKDLRLADQPAGSEENTRGARQRLSPQQYAEKIRHLEREPSMDVIKEKKANAVYRNKA